MKLLGNIIWLVFGGIELALGYIISGALLCLTIIGIPFGWQLFKLSALALWPFGKEVRQKDQGTGCLPLLMQHFKLAVLILTPFGHEVVERA